MLGRRRGRRRALGVVQFQRMLDHAAQHADIHRLADEIEGAGLQCFHRQVHAAEGGDHRHLRAWVVAGNFADQLDAVAVGQAHVGQAQVEAVVGQQFTGFGEVGGGADAQPHAAQGEHQQFADVAFVVNNQGAMCHIHGETIAEDAVERHSAFGRSGRAQCPVSAPRVAARVMRKQAPPVATGT